MPIMRAKALENASSDDGWGDSHHTARDTTHPFLTKLRAIWLNLPEEQADLKD